MKAEEFIHDHTYKYVRSLGYNAIEADEVANMIVQKWKRHEFKKSVKFLDEARKYAKAQFNTMNKKGA